MIWALVLWVSCSIPCAWMAWTDGWPNGRDPLWAVKNGILGALFGPIAVFAAFMVWDPRR